MNNTYKTNKTDWRRLGRSILFVALLLGASLPAEAQTYYVFYNGTYGYIYNNSATPGVSTTFTKSAIWVASDALSTNYRNGRTIYSYTDNSKYMNGGTNTSFTLGTGTGNSAKRWNTYNSYLNYYVENRGYVQYYNSTLYCNNAGTNYYFIPYNFTIDNNVAALAPTLGITVSGLSNGGIQLAPNITGNYAPACTSAVVRNYNNSTTQTYYWTSSTEASTTRPGLVDDWSDATITWAVTTGGTYASVSSEGLVTLTANPTGNVVVRMTVTKGGFTSNNTTTITLTRANGAASTPSVTTITGPTLSPASAALYYNEGSQEFTSSATATKTTTTIPTHTTLTGGGNTYYYYNGTLYASTDGFSTAVETHPDVTLTWVLSGDAASYLTRTPATGASTTVTHTSQSPSDLTATLTVTASATGATPKTATATITAYGPMVAPTITRTGNTISISTTSTGATIYYTTDGTTPTDGSTPYTGPFDLTTSPTTVKAIAIRDGHSSAVTTSDAFKIKLATPVITINNTGLATITAEAGATIRDSVGGAANWENYPTATGKQLTNPQVIYACAIKTNYINSDTVLADYIVEGVSGVNVILDDREDHSWSYYSDATLPEMMRSLNPADVKITYYGDGIMMTGSADYTASSTDYITSTHGDYKVGAKVNVGGEDENTFVYYKTLERESADGTGRCPYKPIPNPFQVRPRYKDRGTTDANDFTGWRGFQCWRLKSVSGGAVYSDANGGTALTTGAVINAETEIYFAPTAEYGMEVELEAVWAIAYVKKANQDNENPVGTNNVGYERNFCVPTTGAGYTLYTGTGKRITNANHIPVTISCYYPDGTAPANTNNSISNTAFTFTADTKFENIPINLTSNTVTLNNYDIIVGRGCGTSTINTLQAINGNVTDLDYTIRLESGTVNNFSFVRTSSCTVSGRYMVRGIMGSDYDRAKGDNDKLSISPSSTLFFSTSVTFSGASNKDQKTFDCVFKSGKYQSGYWTESAQNGNPESDQTIRNAYQRLAYLGQNSSGNTYPGVRYVTVEGGEFSGMCGGRGVGGTSTTYMTPEVITFDLRIKGGLFHGAVYGGAADNPSIGSRRFIITGGEIQSWIAGGCNGTGSVTDGTGVTNGNSYLYVGGTTLVGGDNAMCINRTNGGQVFGAGRGLAGRASSVNHSHVAIADEAVIRNGNNNGSYPVGGNVYGGSYNGTIATESNVYILGGRVEGKVFGGSYGNGTAIPAANVTMTGGFVTDGVYGGSNNTGTVNNVTMQIDGGQVGTSSANANVHGGGYGQATRVSQNVELTLGSGCDATDGVTVYGDVYGGSALGYVNGTSATNSYHTYVSLYKGTIYGGLYGGGLGNSTVAANVYGPVQVKVYGGSVRPNDGTGENGSGGVFGCNNVNGTPAGTVTVDLYGTDPAEAGQEFALYAVYGGGNRSDYTGTPVVTIHGCDNNIEYVYGGGNASDVAGTNVTIWGGHIGNAFGGGNGFSTTGNHTNASADHYNPGANITTGGTNLTIHGGQIDAAFGGSNQYGRINGGITVTVVEGVESGTDPCSGTAYAACATNTIGELYGGGNQAPAQTSGGAFITPSVTISSCDMEITNLFGGAKAADHGADINLVITKGKFQNVFGGNNLGGTITGNVTLTLKGGTMINAFGGNNQGGSITGTITVTVDSTGTDCPLKVENVYGGGNEAAYEPTDNTITSPVVNVVNGTVRNAVFGGGLGAAAGVTANPQVTIGGTGSKHAIVGGRLIDNSADGIGNVYGGGSQADVLSTSANNGNTHVILTGNARVKGNVYGGGNQADVEGNTKVEMR